MNNTKHIPMNCKHNIGKNRMKDHGMDVWNDFLIRS